MTLRAVLQLRERLAFSGTAAPPHRSGAVPLGFQDLGRIRTRGDGKKEEDARENREGKGTDNICKSRHIGHSRIFGFGVLTPSIPESGVCKLVDFELNQSRDGRIFRAAGLAPICPYIGFRRLKYISR